MAMSNFDPENELQDTDSPLDDLEFNSAFNVETELVKFLSKFYSNDDLKFEDPSLSKEAPPNDALKKPISFIELSKLSKILFEIERRLNESSLSHRTFSSAGLWKAQLFSFKEKFSWLEKYFSSVVEPIEEIEKEQNSKMVAIEEDDLQNLLQENKEDKTAVYFVKVDSSKIEKEHNNKMVAIIEASLQENNEEKKPVYFVEEEKVDPIVAQDKLRIRKLAEKKKEKPQLFKLRNKMIELRNRVELSNPALFTFCKELYKKETIRGETEDETRYFSQFIKIRKKLLLSLYPDLQEEKKSEENRKAHVYATPAWKNWAEKTCQKDFARILRFTNPGYFYCLPDEEDKKNQIEKTLHPILRSEGVLASAATDIDAADDRTMMRHRVIISEVTPYKIEPGKAKSVSLMTACAPNLMGSSPRDLERFSIGEPDQKENRRLKEQAYREACQELADLICAAAKNQKKTEIVMPDFGVGCYIHALDADSKIQAKKIMRQAFYEAAFKNDIKITWIIWEGFKNADREVKELNQEYSDRKHLAFKKGDFLKEMSQANSSKIFLNPGSDRTIGGKYVDYHATTLEEQIARKYDLIEATSAAFNPAIKKAHEKVTIIEPKKKAEIEVKQSPVALLDVDNTLSFGASVVGAKIETIKDYEKKQTLMLFS